MSTRSEIQQAIANRLATITTANGYATDVKTVYSDKIPMGIELNSYQLPAIFLIGEEDNIKMEFPTAQHDWTLSIQLWHNEVDDVDLYNFERDVLKCIYANSPTAEVHGEFRGLHSKIVQIMPLQSLPDLHMIEANRIMILRFSIQFRTKLWDF